MTILAAIQKWSESLPAWQRHAIAVLYERPTPTAADLDDIYALLKASKGIADPKSTQARVLTPEQVAAPHVEAGAVQLTAIRDLRGVNALAAGKSLPIAPAGLTVIYGDNGAGKSGYSRVLKQACRARDQSEKIHGNVYLPKAKREVPSAKFDALVSGAATEFAWAEGVAAPVELSCIAIFDSACARAYVDNHGDFAYAPYGLDILASLAQICIALKERAAKEQQANQPNLLPFQRLAQSPTEAGRLVAGLSAKTSKQDINRLADMSQAEAERSELLAKTLAEADPKKRATELRARASRVEGLANRAAKMEDALSDHKAFALRGLIEKSSIAKGMAEAAAKKFQALDALEGTFGEPWGAMFQAARDFCTTSLPVCDFPHLDAEDRCPLCQNTLGVAGSARFAAFDDFIKGEAASLAAAARAAAEEAFRAARDAPTDLLFDEALRHDLGDLPNLIQACGNLQPAVVARRDAIIRAATQNTGQPWDALPALSDSPTAGLRTLAGHLREQAVALDESVDVKERAKMEKEYGELRARQELAALKDTALHAVQAFELAATLGQCAAATATAAISRKSTDLTNTMASQEVADALTAELRTLGVQDIKVAMRPSSARAKTTFKLVLETDGGGSPADVLSEGEQRAIALASFLAEVRLGKGSGGIVFDDPVSSLDHVRRERVAKRLALEAQERQVVVFTHDIFFLSTLMADTVVAGGDPMALTLTKTAEGFGVADVSLPFAGSATKDRVGLLRNKQVNCERLRKANDPSYNLHARDFYSDLRMAWERGVEEVLFNKVVQRFQRGVSTMGLGKVSVAPDDVAPVTAGMTKCSNYTGHDGAPEANIPIPEPADMTSDLNDLETWRKVVLAKNKR
ncbi:AAA family ATPase [Variovorax sp. HJSM1_2]|uniref:AAA family ATPase n=1 Tax=Variovorax sp. HJSM1_2 TaxID=3366263 RepID=UPI003BE0CA21